MCGGDATTHPGDLQFDEVMAMTIPARPGRIVTVFAGKGGCGKTTLATNLAVILNATQRGRVCLVDLDFTNGDVATSLRLDPSRTLAEITPSPGGAVSVPPLLTQYRPGLDCILAPTEPGACERISATAIEDLLAVLPSLYDYVVVDTPARFSTHVLAALDASHRHVLLATPERLALKKLRRVLDILDMLSYQRAARRIVFNQADSRIGLSAAEVERVVKNPVDAHVPSVWDVPISLNLGVPLALAQPDHPVSRALRAFADTHVCPGPPGLPSDPRPGETERRWPA